MQSFDEVVPLLSEWLRSGELVYAEDIVDGIANAPAAFIGMMAGENLGKRLVRIAADPTH
jgi:NADPH-dependent curcumin reductase CurA